MLKIIACLSMLIDHVGFLFFPDQLWLRVIGRLAFPIFAYYIALGFGRTKNKKAYLLRLIVWGVISQIPFAMIFHGGILLEPLSLVRQGINIMFTFALALCGLWIIDAYKDRKLCLRLFSWTALAGAAAVAELSGADYGAYGVLVVLLFYLLKNKKILLLISILALTWVSLEPFNMHIIQLGCVGALPLIWLKLPDPQPGRWKFAFYAFYPLHMTILWAFTIILV